MREGALTGSSHASVDLRVALADRLRARSAELQGAIATRVYAISDPREVADPSYLQGLNGALAAALDYRLAVLELGERQGPAVPAVLLAQARLEARAGVALDTVLRRHVAGNALFSDYLLEEAERADLPAPLLRRLLGAQATFGDRLLAAVGSEHAAEAASRPRSLAERRRECVKRLLAGELVDHSELGYDLDGCWHVGVVAKGDEGGDVLRRVAKRLDRSLLSVQREEEPVWAGWLGGRRPLAAQDAATAFTALAAERLVVTVGEPAEGLMGWRFSHGQAKAALPIADRRGQPVLRYADVMLLTSIAKDDLLSSSLRRLYLTPLERARDGGNLARETLRAYFESERNISSAACVLGVDRRTVSNRLRAVEALIGRPIKGSAAELELALRLDE